MTEPISVTIVEDSPTQAIQLEFILTENGFRVQTAFSGAQALELVRETPPDLVITDIVMPEMDGYELCRRMRQDPQLARIPVILLTSLSEPVEALRAIDAGADAFLTKPYKEEFLLQRIRQVIENRAFRCPDLECTAVSISFQGQIFDIFAGRRRVIDLLLSTYDDAVNKQRELARLNRELSRSLEVNQTLQRSYLLALENSADAVVVMSNDRSVRFANCAAASLFGLEREQFIGQSCCALQSVEQTSEIDIETPSGLRRVAEASVSSTIWEGEPALLASLRDVTARVAARNRLQDLAFTDELTGLANRRGLLAATTARCEHIREAGGRFVVFFVDLDGLKWINDNLGHVEGDQAIKDASVVLLQSFRKTDVVARLGGDEFAVVAVPMEAGFEEHVRHRIEENIRNHNETAGRNYELALSMGVASSDSVAGNVETLLDAADQLMYEDKRARRTRRGARPGGPSGSGEQ